MPDESYGGTAMARFAQPRFLSQNAMSYRRGALVQHFPPFEFKICPERGDVGRTRTRALWSPSHFKSLRERFRQVLRKTLVRD